MGNLYVHVSNTSNNKLAIHVELSAANSLGTCVCRHVFNRSGVNTKGRAYIQSCIYMGISPCGTLTTACIISASH